MNKDWLSFLFIYVVKLNIISLIGTIQNIESVKIFQENATAHLL